MAEKVRLPVVTTSSTRCYRRCQREYMFRYELGYMSVSSAQSLKFGSAMHLGIETLFLSNWDTGLAIDRALPKIGDKFEAVKLEVIIAGYAERWKNEPFEVVCVEQEFRAPLVNPDTGAVSKTFELAGKLDLVVRDLDQKVWIVEHKSSFEDISHGSVYWEKLRIDSQVSNYFNGTRSLGLDPVGVIYDVVGKPGIRPSKATPVDSRKYKKDGTLYANQREQDETPEEFKSRLVELYASNPDSYFVRGEIARTAADETEAARDLWQIAKSIRESQRESRWPRNPESCERYHRLCGFWPVCTRMADIGDTSRFVVDKPHRELEVAA